MGPPRIMPKPWAWSKNDAPGPTVTVSLPALISPSRSSRALRAAICDRDHAVGCLLVASLMPRPPGRSASRCAWSAGPCGRSAGRGRRAGEPARGRCHGWVRRPAGGDEGGPVVRGRHHAGAVGVREVLGAAEVIAVAVGDDDVLDRRRVGSEGAQARDDVLLGLRRTVQGVDADDPARGEDRRGGEGAASSAAGAQPVMAAEVPAAAWTLRVSATARSEFRSREPCIARRIVRPGKRGMPNNFPVASVGAARPGPGTRSHPTKSARPPLRR